MSLRGSDLDPDPLRQFERWFEDAREQGAFEPHAVALATATPDGVPSAWGTSLDLATGRG